MKIEVETCAFYNAWHTVGPQSMMMILMPRTGSCFPITIIMHHFPF